MFSRNETEGILPAILPKGAETVGRDPDEFGLVLRVVDVSPELAKRWLGLNTANRNTKPTAIDKYGRDMSVVDGWLLTCQPIIFDSDNVLKDGQNRLLACVKSKATFRTLVVWGVDPNAFEAMDRNVPRSISDILKVAGVHDANRKSAVLSYIWRESRYGTLRAGGKRVFTSHEARAMLEQYPEILTALDWYAPLNKAGLKPAALGPYLFWRLSRINPIQAEEFFRGVAYGENLKVGEPIHSLRELLADGICVSGGKARRSEYDQDFVGVLVMAAWRYWRCHKTITPAGLKKAALKLAREMESGATRFIGLAESYTAVP